MKRLLLAPPTALLVLTSAWWLIVHSSAAFGQTTEIAPTTENILNAWKQRQAAVKTLAVTWVETKTLHKGSYSHPDEGARMNPKNWTIPEQDETFVVKHALTLDHDKVRYQLIGKAWTADSPPKLKGEESVSTFDGKTVKRLWQPGAANDFPMGYVLKSPKEELNTLPLLPLMLAYRPFDKDIKSLGGRHFRLAKNLESVIDGERCAALLDSQSFPNGRLAVWVQKSAGFFPRRCMVYSGDKLGFQLDLQYEDDPDLGRALVAWKVAIFSISQRLETSSVSRVTKSTLNSLIEPSQFELDFPTGTRVRDQLTRTEYIVRSGDDKRYITVEERIGKASYRDLLESDTGTALARKPAFYLSRGFQLASLAVIAAVVLMVLRRLRLLGKAGPDT